MYCKSCGRQLKEGMRFCDRCGQSVRKNNQNGQPTRRREIEELREERLNRKKRLAEKQAKQSENRRRKKKKSNVFALILIVIIIGMVSFLIGYWRMDSTSNSSDNSVQTTAAPVVTETPESTAKVKSGYSSITIGNLTCPYPADFHANTTASNEKLNITDPLGGATMIVAQDGKTGEPKDLMLEYLNEIGGTVEDNASHAGSDKYDITVNSGDKVYHRKCILKNGIAVYYDFVYSKGSSSESKYKEYIEYIDANFK